MYLYFFGAGVWTHSCALARSVQFGIFGRHVARTEVWGSVYLSGSGGADAASAAASAMHAGCPREPTAVNLPAQSIA